MPYKYQIKKGFESRVFANARNLGNGLIESDEELASSYLDPIIDEQLKAQSTETPNTIEQPTAAPIINKETE